MESPPQTLPETVSHDPPCRECHAAHLKAIAFACFLLAFDNCLPGIPTCMYPDYRRWVDWAREFARQLPASAPTPDTYAPRTV